MKSQSFAPTALFEQSLEEAFPDVDPGVKPLGSRVLVQVRSPKQKTKGGIILAGETQDTIAANTKVAKVRAIGELAFKSRTSGEPWPEGAWCSQGEYVRIPKYGGDRFEVKVGEDSVALFVLFNDLDLIGKITCDPRDVLAFV
jgi:co-chaperonin GroES (HSP10)